MVTPRGQSVDRALAELILDLVQPRQRLLGREAVIGEQRERALQEGQRLPPVRPLDEELLRDTARATRVAPINEDSIADQLLEATLFNAEQTAHVLDGQQGDVSMCHERNTTP